MTKAKKGTDRAGLRMPKGGGGGRRGWSGARWASQPLGGGVIGEREDLSAPGGAASSLGGRGQLLI